MSFAEWKSAFEAAVPSVGGADQWRARLWNLEHESRIAAVTDEFKAKLSERFITLRGRGDPPGEAAIKAFEEMRSECKPRDSRWLGHFRIASHSGIPPAVSTHCLREDAVYYANRAPARVFGPPSRTLRLRFPLFTEARGGSPEPVKRFFWMTFDPTGLGLPDDPTRIKREMGLAHYPSGPGHFMYRFDYDISNQSSYTPTALDAGLYEAWAPPPAGHARAWGTTRDLTSGEPRWPELLAEVRDLMDQKPVGKLVSPVGAPAAIGKVNVDFAANRF